QHHRRHLGCPLRSGLLPGRRVRAGRADDASGRRAGRIDRPRRSDRDLPQLSRLVLRHSLMGNAAWAEAWLALTGALRLARGDRGGLTCFDRSLDGFWRSFRAAAITYPLYLILLTMRVSVAEWQRSGGLRIVIVETTAYVVAWVAFPLIMLTVTRWIGRAHRFFDFMVPYNWCQLPQSALLVLLGIGSESSILGSRAGASLDVVAAIATLVYEWYIARVALEVTASTAAVVVLVDLVLGVFIS